MSDFTSSNQGSLILLIPVSEAAKAWVAEHIPDDATYWGPAIVIEPRYFHDIVEGILDEGLTLEDERTGRMALPEDE